MNKINNLSKKYCSGCKKNKDKSEFCKNKGTFDGLQNYCKQCKAKATKNWRHSVGSGWLEQTKIEQDNKCAICNQITQRLEIDHCHKTEKIRALLCHKCNSLLGMCDDNILILQSAIEYLIKHSEVQYAE